MLRPRLLNHRRAALCLALVCLLTACVTRAEYSTDPRIEGGVVSLVPSVHEWILVMGGASHIVARTEWDDDPRLAHLPSVGGELTPSLEVLAELRPGAVIMEEVGAPADVRASVAALGIDVRLLRLQTIDEVLVSIDSLGRWLDLEAQGTRVKALVRSELQAVQDRLSGVERPTTMFVVWQSPPIAAGAGPFVDDIITLAGGRNVFGDITGWPRVGIEEVVDRDPDIVLWPVGEASAKSLAEVRRLPGWREVGAVRRANIHFLEASLFARPGPRIGEAARRLAELLHPHRMTGTPVPIGNDDA